MYLKTSHQSHSLSTVNEQSRQASFHAPKQTASLLRYSTVRHSPPPTATRHHSKHTLPSLHFMCGKAGVGKSTLTKALAEQHHAALLCKDVWPAWLFPEEIATFDDCIKYSRRIKAVVAPLVTELLNRQSVVLDFLANTITTRAGFKSIVESAKAPHTRHFVDASNVPRLSQIAKRNIERSAGSHELSEAAFHHITSFIQPPTLEEGFKVQVHAVEKSAPDTQGMRRLKDTQRIPGVSAA